MSLSIHDLFLARKEILDPKSFVEAFFLQYFSTSLGDELPNEWDYQIQTACADVFLALLSITLAVGGGGVQDHAPSAALPGLDPASRMYHWEAWLVMIRSCSLWRVALQFLS